MGSGNCCFGSRFEDIPQGFGPLREEKSKRVGMREVIKEDDGEKSIRENLLSISHQVRSKASPWRPSSHVNVMMRWLSVRSGYERAEGFPIAFAIVADMAADCQ